MADTLVELYRIACYEYDGESYGDLVGYKDVDGDYTDDVYQIQYYHTEDAALEDVDNSDATETGYIEEVDVVYFDFKDTLKLDIK